MKAITKNFRHELSQGAMYVAVAIGIVFSMAIISCSKMDEEVSPAGDTGKMSSNAVSNNSPVMLNTNALVSGTGVLVEAGSTTYQYGSHALLIAGTDLKYALRSEMIDLTRFEDKNVTLTGYMVKGYPVDGGPVLLDVTRVFEITAGTVVPIDR